MKRKKNPNQKAFRFVKKPTVVVLPTEEPVSEVGSAKNVSFAMSIAQQMKKRQRDADTAKKEAAKKRPVGRNKQYSESELKTFEKRLLEARESIVSHSTAMKSSVGIEEVDDYEPDGGDGTSQSMRLDALSQLDQSHRSLAEIDDALRKIADGTYGVCLSCGQLVSRERLLKSPFVKTCTLCQQEIEAGR